MEFGAVRVLNVDREAEERQTQRAVDVLVEVAEDVVDLQGLDAWCHSCPVSLV